MNTSLPSERSSTTVATNITDSLLSQCAYGGYYFTRSPTGFYYYNYIINIILGSMTALVGAVANFLVITAYMKTRQRQGFNTALLAYLAISDLLVTALAQPLMISRLILELQGENFCVYSLIIRRLFEFVIPVSFLSVGLITYERYEAIFSPVKYRSTSLRNRIKVIMLLIWLFALITMAMRFFKFFFFIYYFVALVIIIALVVANTIIYIKIGKMASDYTKDRREAAEKQCDLRSSKKIRAKDKRSTRTLFYIFFSLVICYIPMIAAMLYTVIKKEKSQSLQFLFGYLPWVDFVVCLNSTLDPFIYCLRNPRLKHAVLDFVCRGKYGKRDRSVDTAAKNSLMLQNSSSTEKKTGDDSKNS